MHIDHSKLVELLSDASGIEKAKIEKQLEELVTEIREAINEGDAYEVEGLGVFSGIGNNIHFLPSDDFATEINYKYAGMEPIELDSGSSASESEDTAVTEEPEFSSDEEEVDDDPFAGLLDEESIEDTEPSFALDLSDEDEKKPINEELSEDLDEFADEEAEESPFDLADEEFDDDTEEELTAENYKPGPEKWGIDTYKDDSAESMFSGLLGDKKMEDAEKESEDEDSLNSIFDSEDEDENEDYLAAELTKHLSNEPDDEETIEDIFIAEQEKQDEEDDEDFDDPFKITSGEKDQDDIEDDKDVVEKNKSKKKEKKTKTKEDVVPVITNLASEETKKKRKEDKLTSSADGDDSGASKKPTPASSRDAGSQPVFLWVLLIIVALAGGIYGLGYFGVINIPGVTPQTQMAATQTQQAPVTTEQQPESTQQQTQELQQSDATEQATPQQPSEVLSQNQPNQEQSEQNQVVEDAAVPQNQSTYGMRGVVNPAANDGYTIVVYSLSKEGNARAKQRELSNDGYRALLATIPSQQYGQLWRVSIGQFESLRNAAIAAENLESPFSENYFITKIN